MIASAIALLDKIDGISEQDLRDTLTSRVEIEVGSLHGNRLPFVIEADGAEGLEAITRWVQELHGVLHVDVVFSSCEA
jgi:nitrate reductase NapAB chaperone NapD